MYLFCVKTIVSIRNAYRDSHIYFTHIVGAECVSDAEKIVSDAILYNYRDEQYKPDIDFYESFEVDLGILLTGKAKLLDYCDGD
jgi:hypothetical protein